MSNTETFLLYFLMQRFILYKQNLNLYFLVTRSIMMSFAGSHLQLQSSVLHDLQLHNSVLHLIAFVRDNLVKAVSTAEKVFSVYVFFKFDKLSCRFQSAYFAAFFVGYKIII